MRFVESQRLGPRRRFLDRPRRKYQLRAGRTLDRGVPKESEARPRQRGEVDTGGQKLKRRNNRQLREFLRRSEYHYRLGRLGTLYRPSFRDGAERSGPPGREIR